MFFSSSSKMKFLGALCVVLVTGCGSGIKILQHQSATGVNWKSYKTFGFVEVESSGVTNPPLFEESIKQLKEAVITQMKAKGYEPANNADLLINMGIVLQEEQQTRQTDFRTDRPRYMGQRRYSWKSEEIVVGTFKTGTLDFHIVDAAKNNMVWQATIQGIIPEKAEKIQGTILEGVKQLFEKFPG
jgi:hypothetical protein